VRIRIQAHAGARRDAVEGLRAQADGGVALHVSVRAAPEGGKANEAIVALLAREWHVPKRAIRLVSGSADRRKLLHLAGDPAALLAHLESWLRQRTEES
jgi:uncharacterized protein YggU (UPF0235/DUF167 family)